MGYGRKDLKTIQIDNPDLTEVSSQLAQKPTIRYKNILDIDKTIDNTGTTNTTANFRQVMQWCVDNNYIAYVPSGTYLLSPSTTESYSCWKVPNGLIAFFEKGAALKMVDDPTFESKIVYMGSDVKFYGELTLIGNSETGPRYGEMQSNMFIYKQKDVYIERLISKEAWGDNLFVGGEITSQETFSSNIKIDYFQGIDAKRKNLVFQDCNDVYIKTAYLDNSKYNLNSFDVEPDNWENSNGLSCVNTVDYMSVKGRGIDLTANTLSKTAKNYVVNINKLDVHVVQTSGAVLLTYAVTLNVDTFTVSSDVVITKLIDTTYGSFINIKSLVTKTDKIDQLLRMSASTASNGKYEHPTVSLGKVDFRREIYFYDINLIENNGGVLKIDNLTVENHQSIVTKSNNTTGTCVTKIQDLITRNCGKASGYLISIDRVNDKVYVPMTYIHTFYAYDDRTDVTLGALIQFYEPETSENFRLINLYNEKGTPVYFANSLLNKTLVQAIAGSPGMAQVFTVVFNPEGYVSAKKGSLAICTDGNLYIKSVDGGNTGWLIK